MKLVFCSLVVFIAPFALAEEPASNAVTPPSPIYAAPTWLDDQAAAFAQAARESKPVLLDFTGSDWCGWCKRLEAEVFTQKPFVEFARDRLVLLRVDFPRGITLPDTLRRQNDTLSEKYGVSGYPTVVLVDATGREIARSGYMYGGSKTFVRWLKSALAPTPPP
ncbi:thioredoxin family protein [Nibricoccus sp. IMCC34717]|uniref:thioredoxin family protein n=1 Tax=Nibricoccus sp. IMCC34717 TaxID=3034021 RepID=UPI00384B6F3D